jgi:hypothetical protein
MRLKEAKSEENIHGEKENNNFPLDEPNLISCSSPAMEPVPAGHLPNYEGLDGKGEERTQSNNSFNDAQSPRYHNY